MFPTAKSRSNIVDSEYVLVRQLVPTGASPTTPSLITESKEEKKKVDVLLVSQKGKGSNPASNMSLPPKINSTIIVANVKIRYYSLSSAAIHSISVQDLFGSLGVVGVTSTSVGCFASSVKIHSVTAWPPQGNSSFEASAAAWWNSGSSAYQRDMEISEDLPVGVSVTRAMVFKPPKKTLADDWVACTQPATNNIFSLQTAPGTVIDLHVSYTLSNQFSFGTITGLTGPVTPGSTYYLALDGFASNLIAPQHLPTVH